MTVNIIFTQVVHERGISQSNKPAPEIQGVLLKVTIHTSGTREEADKIAEHRLIIIIH